MIEHVHNHITSELQHNTRTDIIFILTSIFLNLITLAVNSGMSKESRTNSSTLIVMFVFVILIILVVSFTFLKHTCYVLHFDLA
jgi:hypothetical protein